MASSVTAGVLDSPALPLLLELEQQGCRDVPYVRAACFSCGDSLPEPRFSRCWRCSLAWRLACRLPVSTELAAAMDAARVA
jgi:hypothetical protein